MDSKQIQALFQLQEPVVLSAEDILPVSREARETAVQIRESVSYWGDAWRRLKNNRIAMVALAVIIALILFALAGPWFVPFTYDQQVRGHESQGPSWTHPFGTDNLGRDLLVRTMVGARISLLIGIVSAFIVLVIGSVYGAISGLFGGIVDNIMMRIVDVLYSVPTILMVIAIKMVIEKPLEEMVNRGAKWLQTLGAGIIAIFIVYGLLYWVSMARIVRSQVLMIKGMEYIHATEALGGNRSLLIRRHLLPNCIGQLIVTTMLQIPSAIFTEAFLSFLGIGVSIPMASLGSLCSSALNGITTYPYRLLFPAMTISLIILAFNLFGDGLRDALDPRLKE